jgi:hypothetical protein
VVNISVKGFSHTVPWGSIAVVTSKPEGDVLPHLVNTVKVPPYIGSLAAVVVTCVVVVVVVVLVVAVCVVAWVVVAVVCVAALVVVEELVLEHDDNTKAATILM